MNIKRILALLLTLLLLFTACGGYYDEPGDYRQYEPEQAHAAVTSANIAETQSGTQTEAAPDETTEAAVTEASVSSETELPSNLPKQGEYYYDVKNVVLYLELYGELPPNYITKDEARALGWEGGSVEKYSAGAAIGGDYFGNYEELLPKSKGRSYTECDIDTDGYSSRGSRRLIFSNDGLYFYTSDHYESFKEVTVTEDYEVIW